MDLMEVRRRMMLSTASGNCLELLGEFTIEESRENDSLGNAQKILDDYVASAISGYDVSTVFLLVAENNTATTYQLQRIIWFGDSSRYAGSGSVLRKTGNEYTLRTISTSSSAYCSLGTVLKLYRLKGI